MEFGILLIGGLIAMFLFSIAKSNVKKAVKEGVMPLDTYINNLGFEPTSIYATVSCIPNQRDVSMFSGYAISTFSRAKTLTDKYKHVAQNLYNKLSFIFIRQELPNKNSFYYPQLGVFLNAEKKLFAVRSKVDEKNPKVYNFSQLQDFGISEDVRESMRGAVILPYMPVAIGFGGKPLGKLSMRVVFCGTSGPESVTLEPAIDILFGKETRERISTNDPIYKIRCEELALICECLQWIKNNA